MAVGFNFPRLTMCSTCLLMISTMTVFIGVISAQNVVTSSSECYNYEISFGGRFLRKFYTCCQNPTTTENTEKQSQERDPIANFQCVKESSFEHKNVSKAFSCKGQAEQDNARQRCTERWEWLEQEEDEPGCWAFSQCFAGACEKEEEKIGSSLNIKAGFCGDGRCDSLTEDSDSCPIDCCPLDNPAECQVVNNTCPEACCGQPLCCRLPIGATSFSTITNFFVWIIVGAAGFIVLLNICMCCCCICCKRLCCKGTKAKKEKEKKSTPV